MTEQGLKEKTVKGVGWSAIDAFLSQGVTFLVGLVLARLLSPEEYGLIGIVTIFTSVLLGVVDSGFSNAIIRKQDATDDDFSTLFSFNMVISIVLFALLFLSAPWISSFFGRPQLIPLVRVMGLLLILQALSIVQYTILSRRIDFKTKTKGNVIAAVSSGLIGIGMAFAGCGVWSLVGQQLSRQLIFSICLWIYNKWRPKFKISIESLRYMWGFGWKILVSGLMYNIWNQLYQVVVGKFYSPATLGQYSRSKEYPSIFSSGITNIVQRVSYPVMSQVQDNKERMVNGYRRIIKDTMFVTAIVLIYMGAIAEPLIYCLIGPKWHEAAMFMPLICISLSLHPLHAINLNMLQVQGRTDIYLYLEVIKKVISIGPLFLGIFVNIYWMLIGSIISGIIGFFLNTYYTGKKLGYSSWRQLRDIAPSYIIAFIVALSVYFFKYLPLSNWVILPIQLIVGTSVFFVVCEKWKLTEYVEIKGIAVEYKNKIFHKSEKYGQTI